MKIQQLLNFLDQFAPPTYQENYDNVGLLVGSEDTEIKQVLVTLDVTEAIVQEAVLNNCNVIVAHHPIIFKAIKSITASNYVERTIMAAIKNDIAIIAAHTNLDNIYQGVNKRMADKLGLTNTRVLSPKKGVLRKLTVFVPKFALADLKTALHQAGAGEIGNYSECAFISEGNGTFRPNQNANPAIGTKNKLEIVEESKIEVIYEIYKEKAILKSMNENHPYEEVAYYIQDVQNTHQDVGAGIIGELPIEMRHEYFLEKVKQTFRCKFLKHSQFIKDSIKTVALCGGSGSFLTKAAIAAKADIFISADFKYHDFFDAEGKILIADIGHYESEQFTKDLLCEVISKKFTNIAVLLSKVNTNPVFYF